MAATPLTADLHPLLTEYVVKKLQKNRITTVYSFVKVEVNQLEKITNLDAEDIGHIRAHLIQRFAGSCYSDLGSSAKDRIVPFSTGIASLDDLLQGGLLPGQIYELCGESGSGKTQLCITIAAHVALLQRCHVFFIDTKCDFSGTKIMQVLNRSQQGKLSERELGHTMARIKVERIFSPELLVQVVEQLAAGKHLDAKIKLKLLIIDSLPSLWYLFQDAKSYCEPLGLQTKLICSLRKLATTYGVAIVLVNLAVRIVEGGATSEGKRKSCSNGSYPALGRFWESAPGTRLLMDRDETHSESGNCRLVEVWKSSYIRSGEGIIVRITDAGVR
uniref:RecA family profile 1 domain-containing protein n=1 Tax=Anopheles farauti TaxID=69004 RepID=A0A182Q5R1_9DIPT